MRHVLWVTSMLALVFLGCDTSPPPAPPGAEEAETSLDVDMGSKDSDEPAAKKDE